MPPPTWTVRFGALIAMLPRMGTLDVGQQAPDFALDDQAGKKWRLSEQRGKVVALVFYPKDETSVCTARSFSSCLRPLAVSV